MRDFECSVGKLNRVRRVKIWGGGGAPFVGRKDAKKGCASSVKALKRGARGVLSRVGTLKEGVWIKNLGSGVRHRCRGGKWDAWLKILVGGVRMLRKVRG